eukprot:m51a1_g2900 hypothetical protein (623) ;mRNA; r:469105-471395
MTTLPAVAGAASASAPPVSPPGAQRSSAVPETLPSIAPVHACARQDDGSRRVAAAVRTIADRANEELERYLAAAASCDAAAEVQATKYTNRRNVPIEDWPGYRAARSMLDQDEEEERARKMRPSPRGDSSGQAGGEGGAGGGAGEDGAGDKDPRRGGGAAPAGESDSDDDDDDDPRRDPRMSKMTELEKRIESIRQDPAKRAELRERIERYKSQRRQQAPCKRCYIAENRDKAALLTTERRSETARGNWRTITERTARTAEARRLRGPKLCPRCHRQIASAPNFLPSAMAASAMGAALGFGEAGASTLDRSAFAGGSRRARRNDPPHNWLALMQVAVRVRWMVDAIAAEREAQSERIAQDAAALTLQRWWRGVRARNEGREFRRSVGIVQRVLRRYCVRWRLRRKNRAADILAQFLSDVQDVTRVTVIVRRFRLCVTTTQEMWRKFDEVRAAQVRTLTLQWQRREDARNRSIAAQSVLWGRKKPQSRGSSRPTSRNVLSSSGPSALEDQVRKVPEGVKMRLVNEVLSQRRKAYALELRRYRQQLQQIRAASADGDDKAQAAAAAAAAALQKPLLNLILSQDELTSLMDRGMAMAQHERAGSGKDDDGAGGGGGGGGEADEWQ